jgi:alcohol dehydrogenase class IV
MKQTEIFGEGRVRELLQLLKEMGAKRIFLVTGTSSYSRSGAEEALKSVVNEFQVKRFQVTSECPDLDFIKAGMKDLSQSNCDSIVAIGGGNVIDTAKAINILSFQSASPEACIESLSNITEKGLPLIAIPTTSGSGSEATHFAVVYSGNNKFSLASEHILPDAAIVDPELTYSLSSYQTALSGIDSFCQAVESTWASGSNVESKQFAEKAISLLMKNYIPAVNSPSVESRSNMSLASNLAGKAINISKTTAPHAVSYTMTRMFGIPHGQAVCITLGEFLKYNYEVSSSDCNDVRGDKFVKSSIEEIIRLTGAEDVIDNVKVIKEMISKSGLKTNLRDLGINSSTQLEMIADNTNAERLANNPRKLSREALLEILKKVY